MKVAPGQEISWIHYSGPDRMKAQTKVGTITEFDAEAQTALCTSEGQVYLVTEVAEGVLESSDHKETPETIWNPDKRRWEAPDGSSTTVPEPISVGILYYGPAYQTAVDFLCQIFGEQIRGMGHAKGDNDEQDGPTTIYCFYIEDDDQIEKMEHALKFHEHADHFEPIILSPVPDEVLEMAKTSVAAELPTLARKPSR